MENNIGDVLNAISVLLIFIIGFFDYLTKETRVKLNNQKPPKAQEKALKKYQKELKQLSCSIIALAVFIFLVLLSMFELVLNIIANSSLVLVGINPLNTLFCLIYICLIVVFLLLIRTLLLIKKTR